MANYMSNESLNLLLLTLGFERGDVTEKNHREWRHPQSGCTLVLPANKFKTPARPADLVGVRAQLHLQGHLDEVDFDYYLAEGKLPSRRSQRR
jgi:hypothetical protein